MTLRQHCRKAAKAVLATGANLCAAAFVPGWTNLRAEEWIGCRRSFSQLGEDRLLWHLLSELPVQRRLYVDVGAHDPVHYSNTLLLYQAGWTGVNIDADEACIRRFSQLRRRDRNICAAVSDSEREVTYLQYPARATNRIVLVGATDRASVTAEQPLAARAMKTRALNDVLRECLEPTEQIGLLNVDCEGEDLKLLLNFDWDQWQPDVVAVESHEEATTTRMETFMESRGYSSVGRIVMTLIFKRKAVTYAIPTTVSG